MHGWYLSVSSVTVTHLSHLPDSPSLLVSTPPSPPSPLHPTPHTSFLTVLIGYICVAPVSVATVCSWWWVEMDDICHWLFCFFLSYLSIIFGSDISTCFCYPHHMIYSPSISCPDPEMAFLFTQTWSFLLCLLRAICSPSQKKVCYDVFPSLFFFLSLFMRLSNVFFPNVVCQWCDILETYDLDILDNYSPVL